jgi:iron complex transport system permease protein
VTATSTARGTALLKSARPRTGNHRARRWRLLLPALLAATAVMVFVSVVVGDNFSVAPADVLHYLTGQGGIARLSEFGINARLPRALLAVVVGAALAAAGTLLQALTRNPLASPDILGVSQGVVAAVLCLQLWSPVLPYGLIDWVLPACGLVGGIGTAAVLYLVTRKMGSADSTQFILIGILISGVLTSMTSLALVVLSSDAVSVFGFISGSLDLKGWRSLEMTAVYLVPGVLLLAAAIPRANALQLGDDLALALGQRMRRDRLIVLGAAVLLTTGAVTTVGALSFVGLLGPHMARRLVGSDLRRLIPAAGLLGGMLVLLSDFLARNIQMHRLLGSFGKDLGFAYLPVGVYLALFGVPFMISIIWRRR